MLLRRTPINIDQSFIRAVTGRPRLRTRLRRWVLRLVWRAVCAVVRLAWRRRRKVAPLYAAAVALGMSAALHHVDRGWMSVLAVGAAGAMPMWWWLGLPLPRAGRVNLRRRRGLKPKTQRCWYAGTYAALVALATATAARGCGVPMPGMWLTAWLTVQSAWIWHHRIRHDTLGQREATWSGIEQVPDTMLTEVEDHEEPSRWTATVDLRASKLLAENVREQAPHIAKRFDTSRSNVMVEAVPGKESLARLTVVRESPCDAPIVYDWKWATHTDDGCFPYHVYPDGRAGSFRLFQRRSGVLMSIFSGDYRTGKSLGMELALTQACFTGMVWPMCGDPQLGASMPSWVGEHGVAKSKARDPEGILQQLYAIEAAMLARNRAMQKHRWVDEYGDTQIGASFYDPRIFTQFPIIIYVLDELAALAKDPEYGAEIMRVVERIVTMASKCGIGLWAAMQNPGLESMGSNATVRQQLVGGNCVAFRNSSKEAGMMILRPEMPGPHDIPIETAAGGHTKGMAIIQSQAPGSSRPTYSRVLYVDRPTLWAGEAIKRVPELDEITGNAMAQHIDIPGYAAPAAPAEPPAGREIVTATAPTQPAKPAKPLRVLDRILALLSDPEHGGPLHTGVIASRLDIPKPTVSETMRRAKNRRPPLVHQPRKGIWAAGPEPEGPAEALAA